MGFGVIEYIEYCVSKTCRTVTGHDSTSSDGEMVVVRRIVAVVPYDVCKLVMVVEWKKW